MLSVMYFLLLWIVLFVVFEDEMTSATKDKGNVFSSFLTVDKPIYFAILTLSIVFFSATDLSPTIPIT